MLMTKRERMKKDRILCVVVVWGNECKEIDHDFR